MSETSLETTERRERARERERAVERERITDEDIRNRERVWFGDRQTALKTVRHTGRQITEKVAYGGQTPARQTARQSDRQRDSPTDGETDGSHGVRAWSGDSQLRAR
jgi:hypothetical protein